MSNSSKFLVRSHFKGGYELRAAVIGIPAGALIALTRFFQAGKALIIIVHNLMGLPPVVVELVVYLALSQSGPLGSWGLLLTPQAMIIAQTVLAASIIAALNPQTVKDMWAENRDEIIAIQVGRLGRVATLVWERRSNVVTCSLASVVLWPRLDPL